jgi:hypothetical protein
MHYHVISFKETAQENYIGTDIVISRIYILRSCLAD